MRRISNATVFSIAAIMSAASAPALAGRCGHSYPVDAPTSFAAVASACNVSIAGLREANPGVDPNNVRPGQHLALPDEIQESARQYVIAEPSGPSATSVAATPSPAPQATFVPITDDGSRVKMPRRASLSDLRWLEDDVRGGGHYSATPGLSYQQASALRIRNANLTVNRSAPGGVLRTSLQDVDIVSKIGGGAGALHANADLKTDVVYTLTGVVVDREGACVTLATQDNGFWNLAASGLQDLVGERVTVWGKAAQSGACGGGAALTVNHSVFAAPW